ncbi:MAG TPA: DUF4838 domain-containing protein [Chthoniobacteraceae bacterium]|nr:DUF4838 domain-containing protein [Chthoniobacteraceae bacterium]
MILKLTSFTLALAVTSLSASANWGTQPLGKAVDRPAGPPRPEIRRQLESRYRAEKLDGGSTLFFKDGKAQCALVLPATADGGEKEAARFLQSTLKAMTGATFPIYPETTVKQEGDGTLAARDGTTWSGAIWIGKTQQAKTEGITADHLRPEGFLRVKRPSGLFIVAADRNPNGSSNEGLHYAVADLVERHFGVRWLWPGELGTIIPEVAELSLPALREQDEPALPQRIIRNGALGERAAIGLRLLKAPESDYAAALQRNARWLAHQKTGSSVNLNYRHAFSHWYEQYGAKHPEWFAMQANGSRQQFSNRPRLCKGNPEVAMQKAREVIQAYDENPKLDSASISPNDGGGRDYFCMCEICRKLDPPNANPVRIGYWKDGKREVIPSYPSLSDRVVTFYNRIAAEVVRKHPEARLGAYAYSNYRDVPIGVSVHPAIIIGFVGLDYTNESLRAEDLKRWDGWSVKARDMILRPNALHGGAALPLLYPRRLAADVRHCYQTGMLAADFDSLTGHWSTQGLNFYILAKLLWDPGADVEALIADYCQSGFGKAAAPIAQYFSLLEETSEIMAGKGRTQIEDELREEENNEIVVDRRSIEHNLFERAYFQSFSSEVMAKLRSQLEAARELAKDDPAVLERIAFLGAGLDYSDRYRSVSQDADDKAAKEQLLEWYRKTFKKNPHILNAPTRLWRTGRLFRGL